MEPKRVAESSLFDAPFSKRIKTSDEDESISCNTAIHFILEGSKFPPMFTNQVISEDEKIVGYKNLSISIQLTPLLLRPYAEIKYCSKEGYAIDLNNKLNNFWDLKMAKSKDQFDAWCTEEMNMKFDTKPILYSDGYELYIIKSSSKDFSIINMWLQKMLIYFVDGSSEIVVDENWCYYLIIKSQHIIGYATTYEFYQSAVKFRSRISQFLVLPPFQNKGIGKKILNAIYSNYIGRKECIEITVEDPSDDFMCMRNLYDVRLLVEYFYEFKQHTVITSANISKYKLSKEKRECIHSKLKLTQNRVIYQADRYVL